MGGFATGVPDLLCFPTVGEAVRAYAAKFAPVHPAPGQGDAADTFQGATVHGESVGP
jgi:hypothetical protein